MGKIIPTRRFERGKKILEQNMRMERSYQKTEWINNMETELWMLEKGPQMNLHPDGLT